MGTTNRQSTFQRIKNSVLRTWRRVKEEISPVAALSILPATLRYAAGERGHKSPLPARVLFRDTPGGPWHPAMMHRKDLLGRPILSRNRNRKGEKKTSRYWAHPRSLVRPANLYGVEGL